MARKYIGLPFGTLMALWAILLWAPDTHAQNMTVTKVKFTLAGSVGLQGVTMTLSGSPGATQTAVTDGSGNFSFEVEWGWSGTIAPRLKGYTFAPASKIIPRVTASVSDLAFTATPVMHTISGSVKEPGVALTGFPTDVVSDAKGQYTTTVLDGWNGKVTPVKAGYQFEPPSKPYTNVSRDMKEENYKSSVQMIQISGSTNVAGAILSGFSDKPVVAGAQGAYKATVKYGWSGKVTVTLDGYEFTPAFIEYPALTENQTNQNYTAKQFFYDLSGSAGIAGVVIKGPPGDQILTDDNGAYKASVPHGWTGMLTPEKPGYNFNPKSIPLTKVVAAKDGLDFTGQPIQYTISGRIGLPDVTLSGLPGDPVSDAQGLYKATVDYAFTGTVTPKKDGFTFFPDHKDYTNPVTANQIQDYKPTAIMYKIQGAAGQPGVTLKIKPGTASVVSGANASYSIEVPWGWTGTLTAQKTGYTFEPNSVPFDSVQENKTGVDFTTLPMQYALTGLVLDESKNGVEGVTVFGDNDLGTATTDASGKFELKGTYGWKGKLTFSKDGYDLVPAAKLFETGLQGPATVPVLAKVRMLTISDKVLAGTEPITGVKITASPGNIPPTETDAKGAYSIKVPYGWSGDLKFQKDGFAFDPDTKSFSNVTEDMENGVPKPKKTATPTQTPPAGPKPVTPPTPTPSTQTPPTQTPSTQTPPTPAGQTPPEQTPPAPTVPLSAKEKQIHTQLDPLQQELDAAKAQIAAAKAKNEQPAAQLTQRETDLQAQVVKLMEQLNKAHAQAQAQAQAQAAKPAPDEGPNMGIGNQRAGILMLGNVLDDVSRRAGVTIRTDATVKSSDPVTLDMSKLDNKPVLEALQLIAQSTPDPYLARQVPGNDRTFEFFKPITNTYSHSKLDVALGDLSTMAGVPIIVDPNVTGDVSVPLENVSLDEALKLMLVGKPLVFKKYPGYYLVAQSNPHGPSFADISITRRVRLNYTVPIRVKAMLSPVFAPYVQAEMPNPRDPNDQGNTLIVTAAPNIVDRIVEDIRMIDREKRQVLLEARVVSMEKGNLLNLGAEWSWPTISAGAFTSHGITNAAAGAATSGWPYGVQIGYGPDQTFTNALMMALNLLEENSQADIIANPTVVAQDGRRAEIRVVEEQWFMMTSNQANSYSYLQAQLQKIESGTILNITPYIGDNNDITMQLAVEVSDSIPKARGSDLPLVTRRMAKNAVTVKDGGTVAVAGLTENRSRMDEKKVPLLGDLPLLGGLFKNKNNDKSSREVAVFVTAHLVGEGTQPTTAPGVAEPPPVTPADTSSSEDIKQQIGAALDKSR